MTLVAEGRTLVVGFVVIGNDAAVRNTASSSVTHRIMCGRNVGRLAISLLHAALVKGAHLPLVCVHVA